MEGTKARCSTACGLCTFGCRTMQNRVSQLIISNLYLTSPYVSSTLLTSLRLRARPRRLIRPPSPLWEDSELGEVGRGRARHLDLGRRVRQRIGIRLGAQHREPRCSLLSFRHVVVVSSHALSLRRRCEGLLSAGRRVRRIVDMRCSVRPSSRILSSSWGRFKHLFFLDAPPSMSARETSTPPSPHPTDPWDPTSSLRRTGRRPSMSWRNGVVLRPPVAEGHENTTYP